MNGNSAETGKSVGPKCGVRAQPSSSQGSSTVVAIVMLLRLIMIDMLMMRMVYLLCFFSLYILYALILLLFLQLTFLLAFAFSTLPFMTRVRRLNASKDYLVCIVWVATMIREEILNAKLITITFIFSSFVCVFELPDCKSTLMLIMMTAIMTVIWWWWCYCGCFRIC